VQSKIQIVGRQPRRKNHGITTNQTSPTQAQIRTISMTAADPVEGLLGKHLSDLPSFVKDMRATDAGLLYWAPDRSDHSDTDYQRGQYHFHEAVHFCFRAGQSNFLSCVMIAMAGHIGRVESGFIDALLGRVEHGAIPQPLSEDELRETTGSAHDPEFRKLESEARSTIEFSKGWGPDALYLLIMSCLTGREGPNIAGAMTMIARTALNGSRN
jgi:hypothetical protein